ncbi:MAG: hypothetical protein AB4041_02735 [Microcystaceae cyanobacterium]
MNSPFRFEPSQRALIKSLAKYLRHVGYIWTVLSVFTIILDGIDLINYLAKVNPVNVLDVFKKQMEEPYFFDLVRSLLRNPFYVMVGILAIKSSHFFYNIVDQEGDDLENLMGGFSQLRNSLLLLYIYAIILISLLWVRIIFF